SRRPLVTLVRACLLFIRRAAPTVLYTLSLHDALPIFAHPREGGPAVAIARGDGALDVGAVAATGQRGGNGLHQRAGVVWIGVVVDRKSTRLNSSHVKISYAVFCLKKKKTRAIP